MKNALDFSIPFSPLMDTDFINCFASVYMFLEHIGVTGNRDYPCKMGGDKVCNGCSSCNDSDASKQARNFFLFDTMSGRSSLRARYDGEPSEMQRWIGDVDGERCGTDDTVEFLFGFSGYAYRKLKDPDAFKAAVIEAIDAGKPVLAKVKADTGYFHVITGYNDNTLICPDYTFAQQKPEGAPSYDNLSTLYIIGDKIAPLYTLKDGLERIKRVMETNIEEAVWDGYIKNIWDRIILPSGEAFR